jgi:hypothetical protein
VLQFFLFYSLALLSALPPGLCHVTLPATRMAAGPTRRTEPRAGNGNGGRGLPALAQAARATCRLARGCRHS